MPRNENIQEIKLSKFYSIQTVLSFIVVLHCETNVTDWIICVMNSKRNYQTRVFTVDYNYLKHKLRA